MSPIFAPPHSLVDHAQKLLAFRTGAGSTDLAFLATYEELCFALEELTHRIPDIDPSAVEPISPSDFAKQVEAAISRMKESDLRRRQELQAKHNPNVGPDMGNLIRRANGEMLD